MGGSADAIAGVKLNRELLLDEIVEHAFHKHVIEKGEFKELGIRTETQFREHANNVIENPSSIRYYRDGRSVYLQESTRTVVFRNPTGSGQSTAFQPENWNTYISKLSKRTTKEWGVSMGEIKRFRTEIPELKWTHPDTGRPGAHDGYGSGKFHNELKYIIDNSSSLDEFNNGVLQLRDRWQIEPSLLPDLPTSG